MSRIFRFTPRQVNILMNAQSSTDCAVGQTLIDADLIASAWRRFHKPFISKDDSAKSEMYDELVELINRLGATFDW